jgi:uncharacterized hydrophobic protein (TIGR00271 family)
MSFFARFKAIDENRKAAVVRTLIENSTPDFDFFYFATLATLMATLGLLSDDPAIVIGSMLLAPLLNPILGIALGLIMSDQQVLGRSLYTLGKAFALGIFISFVATLFVGAKDVLAINEVMVRTHASLISVSVAIVSGLAVAYALARPEWNETLPGIAVSVSLLPPLAVFGIGLAVMNTDVMFGSLKLLGANLIGIIFAAMVSFALMDLYSKRNIAESTIKRESERIEEENALIKAVANGDVSKDEVMK